MQKTLLLAILVISLGLAACAGSDDDNLDTVPPIPPVLVPHLGDTGDDPVEWGDQVNLVLTEENNGIDTLPDGNWIRVLWDPFKDSDLSHLKIWRFDDFNPEPVMVDSISASEDYYLDVSTDLTERVWYSYYIDLVDLAGNSSRSDTVGYALLSKSMPTIPANNATIAALGATFEWQSSGTESFYRLMLFDENNEYFYHDDLYLAMEPELQITLPVNLELSGRTMRWRVDAFDWDQDKQIYIGSESNERIVHFQ